MLIPLSEPVLTGNELKYCQEAVSGGLLTAGPFIRTFEERLSEITFSPYVVAVSSGTAALHLAAILAGVKPETEVICPSISFAATVHSLAYCGAKPIFLDVDEYFCLSPESTDTFIKEQIDIIDGKAINKSSRKHISAILPVHVLGNPCNIQYFSDLAYQLNIPIIEDAAESLGSFYRESNIHTGTKSKFGCLSFNGNKIVTTGGGGGVLCQNEEEASHARHLAQQAKVSTQFGAHDELGYNYRLSNIHAAIGCGQLEDFHARLKRKKQIYEIYKHLLSDVTELKLGSPPPLSKVNHWLISVKCNGGIAERDCLIKYLANKGIETRPLWRPLYEHPLFCDAQKHHIENVPKLISRTICLPSSSNLDDNQIKYIVTNIKDSLTAL